MWKRTPLCEKHLHLLWKNIHLFKKFTPFVKEIVSYNLHIFKTFTFFENLYVVVKLLTPFLKSYTFCKIFLFQKFTPFVRTYTFSKNESYTFCQFNYICCGKTYNISKKLHILWNTFFPKIYIFCSNLHIFLNLIPFVENSYTFSEKLLLLWNKHCTKFTHFFETYTFCELKT